MKAANALDEEYSVGSGTGEVKLKVIIGQGCDGPILVYLNGNTIEADENDANHYSLGGATRLRGASVEVVTTANQTSDSPTVSIEYQFMGGATDETFINPPEGMSQPIDATHDVQFDDSFKMV